MAAVQFVSGIGMIVDCEGEITGSNSTCLLETRAVILQRSVQLAVEQASGLTLARRGTAGQGLDKPKADRIEAGRALQTQGLQNIADVSHGTPPPAPGGCLHSPSTI